MTNIEQISNEELLLEVIKRLKANNLKYSFKYFFDSNEIALELRTENQGIQILGDYNAEGLYNKRLEYEREEFSKIKRENKDYKWLLTGLLKGNN